MLFLRPFNCFKRNGGVKGRQTSLIRYRQGEQVNVGQLAVTLDVIPAKAPALTDAHGIWPKYMLALRTEGLQTRRCIFYGGGLTWIRRVGEYSNECVLRQRTGRPSILTIDLEPLVRRFMMDVRRIKQRNQHIHVEESDHASRLRRGADSRSPM
jgi:hypothetical protein